MWLPWLNAFLFTQAVECPIYLFAQRRSRRPISARLAIAFGASLITHPVVWFAFPWPSYGLVERPLWLRYALVLIAAESFAVAVEAYYLFRFGVRRALLWSLAANAASCSLGFAFRCFFGWP